MFLLVFFLILFTMKELVSNYKIQDLESELLKSSDEEDDKYYEIEHGDRLISENTEVRSEKSKLVHQLSVSTQGDRKGSHYLLVIHGKSGVGKVSPLPYFVFL